MKSSSLNRGVGLDGSDHHPCCNFDLQGFQVWVHNLLEERDQTDPMLAEAILGAGTRDQGHLRSSQIR